MIIAIGAGQYSDFYVKHFVIPDDMDIYKEAKEWLSTHSKYVLTYVPLLESLEYPITKEVVDEWNLNGWPAEMVFIGMKITQLMLRKAIEEGIEDGSNVPKTEKWIKTEGHDKDFDEWLLERGSREATQLEMPYIHQEDLLR